LEDVKILPRLAFPFLLIDADMVVGSAAADLDRLFGIGDELPEERRAGGRSRAAVEVFESLIDLGDPEARRNLCRRQFVMQRQASQLCAEPRVQPDFLTVGLCAAIALARSVVSTSPLVSVFRTCIGRQILTADPALQP